MTEAMRDMFGSPQGAYDAFKGEPIDALQAAIESLGYPQDITTRIINSIKRGFQNAEDTLSVLASMSDIEAYFVLNNFNEKSMEITNQGLREIVEGNIGQ